MSGKFLDRSSSWLAEVVGGSIVGPKDLSFNSVGVSSKELSPGSLFIAIRGRAADGHSFIEEAASQGAVLALVEDSTVLGNMPGVVVSNTRVALGKLASALYENPSEKFPVVGVTGTNGKTTIVHLLYHVLGECLGPVLRIGTLGAEGPQGLIVPETLTTPDPLLLQKVLSIAEEQGAKAAMMEVSSIGLDQHRVDDVVFDVAVFTNLTQDHLDYHLDMDSYFEAKGHLFKLLKPGGTAVVNIDCTYGQKLIDKLIGLGARVLSFGRSSSAMIRINKLTQSNVGSSIAFSIEEKQVTVESKLIGNHNASNIAAVIASSYALKVPIDLAVAAIGKCPPVPGRLEPCGNSDLAVYVDYAHTPDALLHALQSLREIEHRKLWVVFGCGGDRDGGKRPIMGQVAAENADEVVVTSDNPRTEDPDIIISDILSANFNATIVEPDRKTAITKTLEAASVGDIVLIAGKGHEDYQIIGTEKTYFSDQAEVATWFSGR